MLLANTKRTYHPRRTEQNLQVRVCNHIRKNYPDVIFCSDSAAGAKLSDTQRILMMKLRSDDGQPDISIDEPRRGYHGLRIELKSEGTVIYKKDGKTLRKQPYTRKYRLNGRIFIKRGDHLAEQANMLLKYNRKGYFARFCVGYDKAIRLVDWYLERPENEQLF